MKFTAEASEVLNSFVMLHVICEKVHKSYLRIMLFICYSLLFIFISTHAE